MDDKLAKLIHTVREAWAEDPLAADWDSLSKIHIIIEAEKQFSVKFGSEEIAGIVDADTLAAAIDRKFRGKKVLVLDCDGVLWQGVVGEGSAMMEDWCVEFQRQVVELESKGVLICLCSKNNPEDVHEAMRTQWFIPDVLMPLQPERIVAEEISWDSKVNGLRRLAAKLNLGLDSFVFMDDSESELAEVHEALPEVTVIWPRTSSFEGDVMPLFRLHGSSLTEKYRAAIEARTVAVEAADRTEFLKSLNMEVTVAVNDPALAARCAELSQKTNQFNVTLRRLTVDHIHDRLAVGLHVLFCGSVKDRFGDHGPVAFLSLFNNSVGEWVLEDFCVSCRVIGRGFERPFANACFEYARTVEDMPVRTRYVPGDRNQQCEKFFDQPGERAPCTISFIRP